jgi:hypothetical protein
VNPIAVIEPSRKSALTSTDDDDHFVRWRPGSCSTGRANPDVIATRRHARYDEHGC